MDVFIAYFGCPFNGQFDTFFWWTFWKTNSSKWTHEKLLLSGFPWM